MRLDAAHQALANVITWLDHQDWQMHAHGTAVITGESAGMAVKRLGLPRKSSKTSQFKAKAFRAKA